MSEPDLIHVRPNPGQRVRLEDRPRALLPPEGLRVRRTQYWLRRLQDNEVEIVVEGATKPAPGAHAHPAPAPGKE